MTCLNCKGAGNTLRTNYSTGDVYGEECCSSCNGTGLSQGETKGKSIDPKGVKRFGGFGIAMLHESPTREYVLASDFDALAAQLPDGMKHCTIKLETCAECERVWLQPTNWINHGCPHCEKADLLRGLSQINSDWSYEKDARIAAEAALEAANKRAAPPFDPVWLSMLYTAADNAAPVYQGVIRRAYDYIAALRGEQS